MLYPTVDIKRSKVNAQQIQILDLIKIEVEEVSMRYGASSVSILGSKHQTESYLWRSYSNRQTKIMYTGGDCENKNPR